MSGNLWMFSDMLDDEDIEMQKHDFITLYQGADYYGLGLKVFTRMAREAGSVYKIGKKALIRRTIFDEYLRKVNMKSLLKKIRPFIIPIVVTLVVLVLFHSIFMLGYVPTESMEPTLETGSLILGLRIFDELETGDIIIFRRDGSYLVKRIAACAGDTIDHQNSIVTVPDNCYYVLGDNAENSHDSRYWADPYVSHEDVIAKLLMPIK